MNTRLLFVATALLGLASAPPLHAASVPADSQLIAGFLHYGGGVGAAIHYDEVRFELGFADPSSTQINVPGHLDAPLFSSSRLDTDDTGRRLIATRQNDPGFNDFVAELGRSPAPTLYTRTTALFDHEPDAFLANFAPRPLASADTVDWSAWEVTAVVLQINEIYIGPATFQNGLTGTSFRQGHEVFIYGEAADSPAAHAVPSPSAVAAGIGLIGLLASRRRRVFDE